MNRSTESKMPVRVKGTSVEVRRDDVNGALRRLKKILETDNRQKDLARHEYFEKPSRKRKRNKDQAIKRQQKARLKELASGDTPFKKPSSLKWLKGKRSRRKIIDIESQRQRG